MEQLHPEMNFWEPGLLEFRLGVMYLEEKEENLCWCYSSHSPFPDWSLNDCANIRWSPCALNP